MNLKLPPAGEPGAGQRGFALVMALITVLLFGVIGLYLTLTATTAVRLSDNYESHLQARAAALAGLEHTRSLLKGLSFNDQLAGPDGGYDPDSAYLAHARTDGYRLPLGWGTARTLDLADPQAALAGIADDGLVNTGRHPGGAGIALIPAIGVSRSIPLPNGGGERLVSRYLVKVADNSGEAGELALDPQDNPFVDGDGVIIVRSMGIARTLSDYMAGGERRNSVAVFEARFRRSLTFALEAPLVLQGTSVEAAAVAMFDGSGFLVQGGGSNPGIATLDAANGSGALTVGQVEGRLTADQVGTIQGAGMIPSIRDMTAVVGAHPDKSRLLDAWYVWDFCRRKVQQFADTVFAGPQNWNATSPVSIGSYDPSLPPSSPDQNPRVTLVEGDLQIDGDLAGAGLLVVGGRLAVRGSFRFAGIILVAGAGEFTCAGVSEISGAVYVAGLGDSGGGAAWGGVRLTLAENCRLVYDRALVDMAVSLIPPVRIGFREITSLIDP